MGAEEAIGKSWRAKSLIPALFMAKNPQKLDLTVLQPAGRFLYIPQSLYGFKQNHPFTGARHAVL